MLQRYRPEIHREPRVLDPFAGAGTTLSKGASLGWHGTGIELLPPGIAAVAARRAAACVSISAYDAALADAREANFERLDQVKFRFPHVRITQGAFSLETERALSGYQAFVETIANADVRELFNFAALCVLEDISFTRKDGQYLRWDSRSPRELKSQFNKGAIHPFRDAITMPNNLMTNLVSLSSED